MPGAKDLHVHTIFPDVLIHCMYLLYVDFFHLSMNLRVVRHCSLTIIVNNCLNSINSIVRNVSRNGVYFSRMHSPIGCSAQFCSVLLKVSLSGIRGVNRILAWQLYNGDVYRHRDDINAICELMDVKRADLDFV